VTGKKRREWRIEGISWDSDPQDQLCEHERDDFREQAEAALRCMEDLGMRPPFVEKIYIANGYKDGNRWEPENE
jgi:hypothetical protein